MRFLLDLLKSKLITLTLLLFSVGASALPYQCRDHYRHKKIGLGPIPEFASQDYIIMSYFSSDDFSFPAQLKIISNLPKQTKALLLVPESKNPSSPYYEFATVYRHNLAKDFSSLDSRVKSGRIEILEIPVADNFNGWKDHGNWTRDFLSQLISDKTGKIKFLNLKYHRKTADDTDAYVQKYLIAKYEKELGYKIESLNLPFYFEWGNFTSDGQGHFFISEKIFEINAKFKQTLNKTMVNHWIKENFGPRSKVTWIKPLREENTGHVDLMMKFLDSHRVLVAQTEHPRWRAHLDNVARMLELKGYEVHRIQMGFTNQEIESNGWAPFRSYTNALIVNETVYLPQYDNARLFLGEKDRAASQVYRSLGFNVILINNSSSINAGGATHCLTSTIPKLTDLIK